MSNVLSKKDLFDALVEHKYIIFKDSNLIVTEDFYRDFSNPAKMEVKETIKKASQPLDISPPVVPEVPIIIKRVEEGLLTKLILKAEVPASAKTKTGTYAVNKYNDKANKILEKAIKTGVDFGTLVTATKIYYKSGVMPKTIANFFLEGIWIEEYNTLVDKLEEGTKSVQQYVRDKVKEGENNTDGTNRFRR